MDPQKIVDLAETVEKQKAYIRDLQTQLGAARAEIADLKRAAAGS